MKINMVQAIKGYGGEVIKGKDGKVFKVRDAIITSLNSQDGQEIIKAEDKMRMYNLSLKVWNNDEVDLTVEDRTFIKERAVKFLTAIALGRLSDIFEEKK